MSKAMKKVEMAAKVGAAVLLGGALLSGCVLPGEFDAVSNECDSPRFDVETRDAFCSGSLESRVVHEEVGFSSGSQPLVQAQGDFISMILPFERGGGVTLRVMETRNGGESYEEVLNTDVRLSATGTLTSFALLGLGAEGFDPSAATLALVYGRESLRFARVGQGASDGVDDVPQEGDAGFDEDVEVLTGEARSQFGGEGCEPDEEGRQFPLTDVAALSSKNEPGNNFLMVAARCAMVVYAQREGGLPFLVNQYPIKAQDIELDRQGDRMFVASGLDGLQIRTLSTFEAQLDAIFGDALARGEQESDQPGDPDDLAPSAESFTPLVNGVDGFVNVDPSIQALTNVTQVAYTGKKVFFINSPVDTGRPSDLLTYLVSGDLTEGGLLESRRSVPIAQEDLLPESEFQWSLVGLGDSLVAVLGNRTDLSTGQPATSSQLKLYDAPADKTPSFIMDLPLTGSVNSIQLKDGELWAFQRDIIAGYTIKVGGNPL